MKTGLGIPFGPAQKRTRSPPSSKPKRYPPSLSVTDWWDPLVSTRSPSTSIRISCRKPPELADYSPLNFQLLPALIDAYPRPIKHPPPPPPTPFPIPAQNIARAMEFLIGARRICGHTRTILATLEVFAARSWHLSLPLVSALPLMHFICPFS
jgi:hypothetical protein